MKKLIGNVLLVVGLVLLAYTVGLEAGMIPLPVIPA